MDVRASAGRPPRSAPPVAGTRVLVALTGVLVLLLSQGGQPGTSLPLRLAGSLVPLPTTQLGEPTMEAVNAPASIVRIAENPQGGGRSAFASSSPPTAPPRR